MIKYNFFGDMFSEIESALSEGKIKVLSCELLDKNTFESEQKEQPDEFGRIFYILKGTFECKCIDGRQRKIQANEIFLIPSGMPHCVKNIGNSDVSAIYIRFRTVCFEVSRCIHVCDRNFRILWLFQFLQQEFESEASSSAMKRYLFGAALLMMLRIDNENKEKTPTFDRVVLYLRLHINEKVSINELSEIFYVSPSYLCRLFQKKSGMTVMNYLCRMRIDESKRYLKETNYGIEEIAYKVGFASSRYFTRKFKEIVGVTPSHFRRN